MYYAAATGLQVKSSFCCLLLPKVREVIPEGGNTLLAPPHSMGSSPTMSGPCRLTARSKDRLSRSKSTLSHPVSTDVMSSPH